MSQDYNNPAFKKLLQKLQEESWQLELLISGFAIFGLFTIYEPLSLSVAEAQNNQQLYKFTISFVAVISCAILIFNLILHVLLRGLWIGALGLRYVSGDIEYDELKYSQKFTKYLKRKVGSFDKYIATLENYCSIIFAISFLLIFYVLAITFTILTIAFIGNYIISNDWLPQWLSRWLGIPLMVFVSIGMLLTFLDFITLGFLKKKKWISMIYFPIYWLFSYITLSFLYRPLVYNFLDHKFGRRLSFILVPFYLLVLVITSFKYQDSNYINADLRSSSIIANVENYEDQLANTDDFTGLATIPSKVIKENYLRVFMRYSERIEDRVFSFNPDLKPKKDIRGLKNDIIRFNESSIESERDSVIQAYLKTFSGIYTIQIDSMKYHTDFILTENFKEELGFETYIDLDSITRGKHLLNVNRMLIKDSDTTYLNIEQIPFWYFRD